MSYPKAFYTMSYTEFMALWVTTQDYDDFMNELTNDFTRYDMDTYMKDMYWNTIFNKWHEYETAGETIYEQADFIKTTYREHKMYHLERLALYSKKLAEEPSFNDMLERVTSVEGSTSKQDTKIGSGSNSGTSQNKSIHVDLPNKQIDSSDIYKYPSDGDKIDNQNSGSYSDRLENRENGKSDSTSTTTDPSRYYEMYNRALRACSDIMLELADDYSDCFIHIF